MIADRNSMPAEQRDASPSAEISFKTAEDSSRAWRLVAWGKPTIGTPNRGMIVNIAQLELLKQAGIPVYPPHPNGRVPEDEPPLDIDKLIARLREVQLTLSSGG